MSTKQSKQHRTPSRRVPTLLAIGGVLLLVVVILLIKQETKAKPVADAQLPEVQLQAALDAGQPTLAFFHSLTCVPCKEMTAIVKEVQPEFAGSIVLVDVDVYDQRNAALLQSSRIHTIPTLIFFDRAGKSQVHMGVMEADQLRQTLIALGGGN